MVERQNYPRIVSDSEIDDGGEIDVPTWRDSMAMEFAKIALKALYAENAVAHSDTQTPAALADFSYQLADAMIARGQRGSDHGNSDSDTCELDFQSATDAELEQIAHD